ncbi:MAG: hypothetical protein ACJA2C_002684 [Marinoscillum sp.]|jgi:uncharacterized protein YyaL (SSP411 family)
MNNSTNALANETSPYLLQHANNPVNWQPWGEKALAMARDENKPILLSIGYSSCHWCHVMAHESFEDDSVAAIMNENFINIKLDREERPDIDQIYMDAVQAMGLRGGWPLNVFLTSDQKPFYGGTYFPKSQWIGLLNSISDAYSARYEELYSSASKFAESINESEAKKYGLDKDQVNLSMADFDTAYSILSSKFDPDWGGIKKAPKFPMPSVWDFLGQYSAMSENEGALKHFTFTLDKIGAGGIYDQIGGGFSRYSVDGEWHVPHFEKMLYDNGQLLSLYADGYKLTQKSEYANIIAGTTEWMKREMQTSDGALYSALDADSEGEEGKFYVWEYGEFMETATPNQSVLAEYYDVSKEGNWEEGKNVLRVLSSKQALSEELNLEQNQLDSMIETFNKKALSIRDERIRPGLDSKVLSGWNGLALTGLCKAYQALGTEEIAEMAKQNAQFLSTKMINDAKLIRVVGQSHQAYLEDYSAVIQAYIAYYETFFDETYLALAKTLSEKAIEDFYDNEEGLFYFTSAQSETLIARKKEIFDNVIPASNSIMAENLYKLGLIYDLEDFKSKAIRMVNQVNKLIKEEPEYLSNWASVSMMMAAPTAEIIIIGDEALDFAKAINETYVPNSVIMASKSTSTLPLFEYKEKTDQTTIYVCYDKVCKRPVYNVADAIKELNLRNQ